VDSSKSHPRWGRLSAVASDPGGGDAPTAADRAIAYAFVLVSVCATALVTARRFSTANRAGLLALAFAALALALGVSRWRRALRMPPVIALSALLLVLAVARWPRDSTDIWSYAAYGRMVSHYGASPYRHVPVEYSNDRAIRRVKPTWQNTSSVYGPLWNGISAGVVSVTQTDQRSTRIWFQSLAALSVFLAVLLIAGRTRSPAAAALIGLNPLVVYDVVNGGHNDALVGLALLAGVLLASRDRFKLAALAIALGALVKLVALLGFVALIVWIVRKRGVRPAAIATGVGGGVVVAGYALSGGLDAITPLRDARLQMSRNSIWLLTNSDGRTNLFGLGRVHEFSHDFLQTASTLSTITVVVLAAIIVAGHLRDNTPTLMVGGAVVAYLLAGAYVLPWYAAWALPVLVLEWRSGLSRLVLAQSALYLIAYQYRQGVPASVPYRAIFASNVALVFFELTIIVALVVMIVRQRRPERPRVEAAAPPTPVAARLD
jgi:alpha-1,6-mannosyltransferase